MRVEKLLFALKSILSYMHWRVLIRIEDFLFVQHIEEFLFALKTSFSYNTLKSSFRMGLINMVNWDIIEKIGA